MNPNDFTVYDIQAFPQVCFNQLAVQPGYARQWVVDMRQLRMNGASFVVIYDHMRVEEASIDWRQRGD